MANLAALRRLFTTAATSPSTSSSTSAELRHHLVEHLHQLSSPLAAPPKISKPPPSPFDIIKDALRARQGPVLRRSYGDEEISLSVSRRALGIQCGDGGDAGFVSELSLYVDVSRPGRENSLMFLCGLYPDGVRIQSVCLVSNSDAGVYQGRVFPELNQKLRTAFDQYLQARGVDGELFTFLQAWLYKKDHHNLVCWFENVNAFLDSKKPT